MQTIKSHFILILFFLYFSVAVNAQITGKVIDAKTKEAVIGASVKISNSSIGTITDINGIFILSTTVKKADIEISYIGYSRKKIVWSADVKELNIELSEDAKSLDEVVVIGYGMQKKSDLTGSVSSIKSEDIKRMQTTTVAQALQGKASGVEVVRNSGAPGSSTSIRIRGMGTINNSEPLYVVDGMPMDRIDFISADDIESVEILKDAASSAIYGSRAANGVVLVSTKSGKESNKKFNANLSTYYGMQDVVNKPFILSKEDYSYFSDYVQNQPNLTQLNSNGKLELKPATQNIMSNCNNWWDEVTQQAPMYKANLSLNGGTKDLTYYLSAGYQNSDGIIKRSNYNRTNLNLKINARLHKNVNFGANVSYAREDKTLVEEGNWGIVKLAVNYSPQVPILDAGGNYSWTTPVETLRRTTYDWYNNNLMSQFNLDWDIVKGLKYTTRVGFTTSNSDVDKFNRMNTNPEAVGNVYYTVARNPISTQNFSYDNILSYILSFNDHNLNIMVGETMETSIYSNISASGTGYGGYDTNFDALSYATNSQSNAGYSEGWSALGILGRLSYDYKGRYLVQANFREDASSRFAPKNRWGFFPSVSAGWKLTGEEFMKNLNWVSLLKVRIGWGQLGNNRIGNNTFKTLVGSPTQYIYGIGIPSITPAMSITQYGNYDVLWERTESTTLGLDINLFNNRLTSTFDLFVKDTKDMLINIPIVSMSGYPNTPMQNAGSVRNKGVELQLSWKDKAGDFTYEIGGNITYVQNRVISLGSSNEPILGGNLVSPNPLGYVNRTQVGVPIGAFYGWKTDGVMQSSDFDSQGKSLVPTFASANKFNPGDMKFVDINKDGKIDDNDRTYLGSPQPNIYYGANINLGYKGFELTLFFQGVAGNQVYNVNKFFMYSPVQYNGVFSTGSYSNSAQDYFDKVYRPQPDPNLPKYRDYWGANLNGKVPAPSTDPSRNEMNFRNSDFYIENGDYLRLKNLQLSYSLPKKICQESKLFQNFRTYISVSNVFTLTPYTGVDPEVGSSGNLFAGIDQGTYPQARSYTFGVVVDF